jgi:[acyl-carrier-protein] S-malonyltransferase
MKTAFLFPGQGSQAVGMGQDLYREFDYVREIFDMAEETCRLPIARLCFKGPIEKLTETVHLQPAVTAVNLSVLAALRREAPPPQFAAGHSLGEYGALAAADAVSFQDAFRLVFRRGELMHRESLRRPGAMSAIVGLSIEAVEQIVSEVGAGVSVANHNTAEQIVITGVPAAVDAAAARAAENGGRAVALKVSGAWHSELIRGAEAEFQAFLETIPFSPPQVPVLHNVTAAESSSPEEARTLLSRQLCSPVRWYDTVVRMLDAGVGCFVEAGPGRVLTGLVKKIRPPEANVRLVSINSLKSFEKYLNLIAGSSDLPGRL